MKKLKANCLKTNIDLTKKNDGCDSLKKSSNINKLSETILVGNGTVRNNMTPCLTILKFS